MRKRVIGSVLVVLLGTGTLLPEHTRVEAQIVAQIPSQTVTGRLDENSQTLDDGSYYNVHAFEGTAGETISIEMLSTAFDTYLILVGPDGSSVAEDDDGSGNTDARIVTTLPSTGTYQILANSYSPGETGEYTLAWRAAAPEEVAQNTALRRATELNQQAIQLYRQGRYSEAEPLLQQALAIRREQLGDNHPSVATSLNNLAVLYREQGRYDEAESLFQQSLVILRAQLGNNHRDVAANLNNLAVLYWAQGRYGEAGSLFQQSLSIQREQLGNDHPNVATSLNNLAVVYREQGRYDEAELFLQQTLSIRRGRLGENHPDVAQSLNNLADLYQEQGRYGEAEITYQQSLDIYREQLGNNHPTAAISLNDLAGLYYTQGRYSEAEPLYQQSLDIYREQLGNDHPSVASVLNNLALLYEAQGRYGEAEPRYQQSLAIYREQLGENHPDVATSLSNLAGLYQDQGRYGEAEPLYQQSLVIRREQLGENHPDVAVSLNNLALLYQLQGRYGEAEPPFLQALAILQEQLGENHPDVATNLSNLAALYQSQGRYGEAEPLYQQSLVIDREQLGQNHPSVATSLNNLALLYQVQGRYGEAEPLYQQSLSISREQLGDNHPLVATSLSNLAGLYQAQGDIAQAIDMFQQGLDIQEWNLETNLATLTETQRQDYAATLTGTTDWAISLSLQATEARTLGFTTLLRRKGRLLDAGSNSLQRLRGNLTLDDRAVLDHWVSVQQQLATLTFNPPENLPTQQYRQQLVQLEAEANEMEKTLAQRSDLFRVETEAVEIEAVQAQLPADGVLVEYARYRPYDAQSDRFGESRYAAYLLFPSGDITAIDLGPASDIDTAVLSLASALEDANQRIDEIQRRAQILDGLVMAPLRAQFGNAEHLLISPDGALNQIPFEVLHSDGQYLVEAFEISYLNSGRDLLKFDILPASEQPSAIFASPNYGEVRTELAGEGDGRRSVDLASLTVAPLEYAFREGRALSALLPDAEFLTGRAATETALKQVHAPRLLHIATHGLFLGDAPRRQRGDETEEVPIENPLLRAMLAMEGFNARSSGEEDGIFTALEAANLNLYGTQLVVLSACETGQGEVVNGEGVYGLRRAFALAGAESLMMSLWKVEDEGTQDLMVRYYENLLSGMGRSEALRDVQLAMISSDDDAHPYYWAAFVLAGNWQPL